MSFYPSQERVYRCIDNHWVEDDAIEIVSVCQTNGEWLPDIENIVCTPYDCRKLPDVSCVLCCMLLHFCIK